jgi:yeast amino acid transporter
LKYTKHKKEKRQINYAMMEETTYPKDKVTSSDETHDVSSGELLNDNHGLKRHLSNRKIQMIAIGGSIGTAMFVSIGSALTTGGPASLLIAYTLYSCVLALVNNAMAEMAIYMPVNASFIRHASVWVDDAWGFMAGWNFFFYEAILIPFEISALNLILKFWSDSIPVGAICAACIVSYGYIHHPPRQSSLATSPLLDQSFATSFYPQYRITHSFLNEY